MDSNHKITSRVVIVSRIQPPKVSFMIMNEFLTLILPAIMLNLFEQQWHVSRLQLDKDANEQ